MGPRELIEKARSEGFVEDGEPCRLSLIRPGKGLNEAYFREHFKGTIPAEYAELLRVASGFSIGSTQVNFTEYHFHGFNFLLEDWMEIMADGFGNFWCLEMFPGAPNWGPVWFVCDDPPAIVRIAADLTEFLSMVLDAHRPKARPNAWTKSWESAASVARRVNRGTRAGDLLNSADPDIRDLASAVDPECSIVRLRTGRPGFSWRSFDAYHENKRRGSPMLFAMKLEPGAG